MIKHGSAIFLLGLLLAAFSVSAEPENVMVDGYTFTRPEKWKWRAPTPGSTALSNFVIPNQTGTNLTDVRFYSVKGDRTDLHKRIRGNFEKGVELKESTVKVRETTLTYITVLGTAVAKEKDKTKTRPNYQFIGLVLPAREKDKPTLVRLFGPQAEVQAAEADFKQMVERAVREIAEQ